MIYNFSSSSIHVLYVIKMSNGHMYMCHRSCIASRSAEDAFSDVCIYVHVHILAFIASFPASPSEINETLAMTLCNVVQWNPSIVDTCI